MDITEGAINGEMIVADAEGQEFLAGSVARQVLPQGVPIARSFVVRPGDRGFLAAVLPKGMRAITIPDRRDRRPERPGAARRPGRPDPDLFHRGAASGGRPRQRDGHLQHARAGASTSGSGPRRRRRTRRARPKAPPIARTATLEVSPHQAEMVTLAQTLGTPVADPQLGPRRRRGADGAGEDRRPVSLDATAPAPARGRRRRPPAGADDARVRRHLDQQGADRARRSDPRHRDRRRGARSGGPGPAASE